jgi:hypothetical protein
MGPRPKLGNKYKGVGHKGVLGFKHTPTSWDNANEVNPKHFQMGIVLGIKILKCPKSLGKNANNKHGSNCTTNISFEKVLKLKYPNCVQILHLEWELGVMAKRRPRIKCIV